MRALGASAVGPALLCRAFVTLGIFAIAHAVRHDYAARIALKTLAGVLGAAAVAMGVYGFSCWASWVRARRRAGLSWRR
jgi:hypothetical protein